MHPLVSGRSVCDCGVLHRSPGASGQLLGQHPGVQGHPNGFIAHYDLRACMFYVFQYVANGTVMCAREVEMW